jgi:hypothetical protein
MAEHYDAGIPLKLAFAAAKDKTGVVASLADNARFIWINI